MSAADIVAAARAFADGLDVSLTEAGNARIHITRLADTIEQLITDLDARFEHSDHQSAKYYQRMCAAEKEAAMRRSESADFERERDEAVERLDRVHKLAQPWADRIDLEQVGTHSPDCYTWHVDCLILSIRHTIENDQTEGNR